MKIAAAGSASNSGVKDNDQRYYSPEWSTQPSKVDIYNYVPAEMDLQFKGYTENNDGFSKFAHGRKPYDVENQVTLSGNRDTIRPFGVFDMAGSPLTISLSETNGRYMTLNWGALFRTVQHFPV